MPKLIVFGIAEARLGCICVRILLTLYWARVLQIPPWIIREKQVCRERVPTNDKSANQSLEVL